MSALLFFFLVLRSPSDGAALGLVSAIALLLYRVARGAAMSSPSPCGAMAAVWRTAARALGRGLAESAEREPPPSNGTTPFSSPVPRARPDRSAREGSAHARAARGETAQTCERDAQAGGHPTRPSAAGAAPRNDETLVCLPRGVQDAPWPLADEPVAEPAAQPAATPAAVEPASVEPAANPASADPAAEPTAISEGAHAPCDGGGAQGANDCLCEAIRDALPHGVRIGSTFEMRAAIVEWMRAHGWRLRGWTDEAIHALGEQSAHGRPLPVHAACAALSSRYEIDILLEITGGGAAGARILHAAGAKPASGRWLGRPTTRQRAVVAVRRRAGGAEAVGHAMPRTAAGPDPAVEQLPIGVPPLLLLREEDTLVGMDPTPPRLTTRAAAARSGAVEAQAVPGAAAAAQGPPAGALDGLDNLLLRASEARAAFKRGERGGKPLDTLAEACASHRRGTTPNDGHVDAARVGARLTADAVCALASSNERPDAAAVDIAIAIARCSAETRASTSKKRRAAAGVHVVVLGARACARLEEAGPDRDRIIVEQLARARREARCKPKPVPLRLIAVLHNHPSGVCALVIDEPVGAAAEHGGMRTTPVCTVQTVVGQASSDGSVAGGAGAGGLGADGKSSAVEKSLRSALGEVAEETKVDVGGGPYAFALRLALLAASAPQPEPVQARVQREKAEGLRAEVQHALIHLLGMNLRPTADDTVALEAVFKPAVRRGKAGALRRDTLWTGMAVRLLAGDGAGSSSSAPAAARAHELFRVAGAKLRPGGAAIVVSSTGPAERAAGVSLAAAALRDGLQVVVCLHDADDVKALFVMQRSIAAPTKTMHVWRLAGDQGSIDPFVWAARADCALAKLVEGGLAREDAAADLGQGQLDWAKAVLATIVAARTRYRTVSALQIAAAAALTCEAATQTVGELLGKGGGSDCGGAQHDPGEEELALAAHAIEAVQASKSAVEYAFDALKAAPTSQISGGRAVTVHGDVGGCAKALRRRSAWDLPDALLRAFYLSVLSERPGSLLLDAAQLSQLRAARDTPAAAALAHVQEVVERLTGTQCCARLVRANYAQGGGLTLDHLAPAALGKLAKDTPLLVMLGRCPSPAFAGGLFGEGSAGALLVEAQTAVLARLLLGEASDLRRPKGAPVVVLCLEAANPLWFCPRLQALHCAPDGTVTKQANPCGGGRATAAIEADPSTAASATEQMAEAAALAINAAVLEAVRRACPLVASYEFPGGRDSGRWLYERVIERGHAEDTQAKPAAIVGLRDVGAAGELALWPAGEGEGEQRAVVSVRVPHLCCALRRRNSRARVETFECMRQSMRLLVRAASEPVTGGSTAQRSLSEQLAAVVRGWAKQLEHAGGGRVPTPPPAARPAAPAGRSRAARLQQVRALPGGRRHPRPRRALRANHRAPASARAHRRPRLPPP